MREPHGGFGTEIAETGSREGRWTEASLSGRIIVEGIIIAKREGKA